MGKVKNTTRTNNWQKQRQKLKPDAMEAVFRHFNSSVMALVPNTLRDDKYRFLAADGSTHTYTDALIQPVHCKNEFSAFCDMVDRHGVIEGRKNIYIGNRGYCSYNNMAHVLEQNQFFLFRTKDIHSKGLVGNFDFPEEAFEKHAYKVNFTIAAQSVFLSYHK